MKFTDRLKTMFRSFMAGRNGVDKLSNTLLWAGVALLVVAMLFNSYVLNILAIAIYLAAILRIFSRNIAKRSAENRFFVTKTGNLQKAVAHRRNRFKNRKQYRYFKCPQCKSWLRVPRHAGTVKVTCGKCARQFSYIAK
jgi:ribosomal protein L37AE/L43A